MEIGAIIIALILIWIAWKVFMGLVKFAAIALILVAALLFITGAIG